MVRMFSRFKGLAAKVYLGSRSNQYELPFAGRTVQFLTDRPYSKSWYHRNRLRGAVHGYHEPALTLLLERLATNKHELLDVGSHLGYFSILFASVPGNRAVAVELDPTNFRELARSIDWQPESIRSRIEAVNIGISDSPGTIRVPQSRPHDSSHRIDGPQVEGSELLSVRLTTIDALTDEMSFTPGVVKIDVEGFEVHALRGATKLLFHVRPVWLIEIHPPQIRSVGEQVPDVLLRTKEAGYRHFQFREHRGLRGSVLTEDVSIAGDGNRDIVCIHSEDASALAAVEPLIGR